MAEAIVKLTREDAYRAVRDGFVVMCKEYRDDDDYVELDRDDLENWNDNPEWQTFEIWTD